MFEPVDFDWDEAKARANELKHGISFVTGARIFLDPDRFEWDVSRAADREVRSKAAGFVEGRLLVVVFTVRNQTCRIISARPVNSSEERTYGNRSV
jgi:uncharacterized DUF497 family protein